MIIARFERLPTRLVKEEVYGQDDTVRPAIHKLPRLCI
jgi:hypothetical protein